MTTTQGHVTYSVLLCQNSDSRVLGSVVREKPLASQRTRTSSSSQRPAFIPKATVSKSKNTFINLTTHKLRSVCLFISCLSLKN